MKEMSCTCGHKFNRNECKEMWQGMYPCPVCWPNGFLRKNKEKNEKNTYYDTNLVWVNGDGSIGS